MLFRSLLDVLTAGVVEVRLCGEDFNGLGTAAGERVEQAGVQTLTEKGVGGEGSKHGWWSIAILSSANCGGAPGSDGSCHAHAK